MKHFKTATMISSLIALIAGISLAQSKGGSITGFVTIPSSVKDLEKVIVLACAEADEMCAKPAKVASLKGQKGTKVPYTLSDLPAGKYTVYALNDLNDNRTHDPDSEELGGYFKDGTFDPILVAPPAKDINIEMIGITR
jgi:uncharacterized protein (DUF2141 family)